MALQRLWTPADASSAIIAGWFDAKDTSTLTLDENSNVSEWRSKTGDWSVTQSSVSNRPTFNSSSYNNLPAVNFYGNNLILFGTSGPKMPTGNASGVMTGVSARPNSSSYYATIFAQGERQELQYRGMSRHNNTVAVGYYANDADGDPSIPWDGFDRMFAASIDTAGNNKTYVDGGAPYSATLRPLQTPSNSPFYLGGTSVGDNWNNPIQEVIFWSGLLSNDDIDKLFGYYAWRWNLVSQLPSNHPYKNAAPTVGVITASATITEENDASSSAVKVYTQSYSSIIEESDTMQSSTLSRATASAILLEQDDTFSANAVNRVTVTSSTFEESDTFSSSAQIRIFATTTLTEDADSLTSTSRTKIVASASIDEDADLLSAGQIQVRIIGKSTEIVEADDTITAAGTTKIRVTSNLTEEADTVDTTISNSVLLNSNITEDADNLTSAIKLLLKANGALAEQDDVVVSSTTVRISATATLAEESDIMTAFFAGPGSKILEASITEDADTLASIAKTAIQGHLLAQEDNDSLVATSGLKIKAISVTIEDNDSLVSLGTNRATGYVVSILDDDTLVATYTTALKANATIVEESDDLVAYGRVVTPILTPAGRQATLAASLSRTVTFTLTTGYRVILGASNSRAAQLPVALSRNAAL